MRRREDIYKDLMAAINEQIKKDTQSKNTHAGSVAKPLVKSVTFAQTSILKDTQEETPDSQFSAMFRLQELVGEYLDTYKSTDGADVPKSLAYVIGTLANVPEFKAPFDDGELKVVFTIDKKLKEHSGKVEILQLFIDNVKPDTDIWNDGVATTGYPRFKKFLQNMCRHPEGMMFVRDLFTRINGSFVPEAKVRELAGSPLTLEQAIINTIDENNKTKTKDEEKKIEETLSRLTKELVEKITGRKEKTGEIPGLAAQIRILVNEQTVSYKSQSPTTMLRKSVKLQGSPADPNETLLEIAKTIEKKQNITEALFNMFKNRTLSEPSKNLLQLIEKLNVKPPVPSKTSRGPT